MPNDHWRGPTALIVFGAIVLFLSLWLVWDLSAIETRKRVEAEKAAAQYAQNPEKRITSACDGREGSAFIECVYKEAEATHENKRSEYDLAAQEGMFRWARYMTIITALGAVLTGVGAVFVWMAISNDREVGHAQVRAYVCLRDCWISKVTAGEFVVVNLGFINSGQSPCFIEACAIGISTPSLPIVEIPDLSPVKKIGASYEEAGGCFSHQIKTKRVLTQAEFSLYDSGNFGFVVSCKIIYRDVFRAKQETMVSVYRIAEKDTPEHQMSVLSFGNYAT
jgi:hypothetical protein